MKILITGGAGFIGSHLTERILASGGLVRVLDNLSTGKLENLPKGNTSLEFIRGDIQDWKTVSDSVRDMDAVVHLAAVASVQASIDQPMETHRTNFDGTLNLLEASRVHGVKRLVYASSAAVYGDTDAIPVSEDAIPNPLSPYAVDKLSGEYYLRYYFTKFGLPVISFRFFNIYGPRQDPSSPYSGVISIFSDRLRKNLPVKVYGDGLQTRDFVYVADLADLLARAVHGMDGIGGIFNVGTGKQYSLLQLLEHLEEISGMKIERHHEPARLGDIQDSCADVSRLRKVFGSAPDTPFGQGLKKLLESLNR
jgi:UDP-glucose 4-epimerase